MQRRNKFKRGTRDFAFKCMKKCMRKKGHGDRMDCLKSCQKRLRRKYHTLGDRVSN